MSESELDGIGILVTRPRQQAARLVKEIERRGGFAVSFPAIQIVARNEADVLADVAGLQTPAITIFISRNAVDHGLGYAGGQLAAIGPATAEAIDRAGGRVDLWPASGFDTEHLLAEPAFQDVAGKTIRIIRGDGGRELLASSLRERGARVDYVSAYKRKVPEYSADQLSTLERRWRAGDISATVVMSVQSLENLGVLLPDWCREQLALTPLVTPAARVLKEALNQYPGILATLAAGPRDGDIVDALVVATASFGDAHTSPGSSK